MQNKNSEKHNQYKNRPRIEDFVSEMEFDNEVKNTILNFTFYLRANKMSPQWTAINSWKFLYKKERIGYIRFINDSWFFDYIIPTKEKLQELINGSWSYPTNLTIDKKFEDYAISENLEEYILDNVKYCKNCISMGHCHPKQINMFEKTFKKLCWNGNVSFKNPTVEDMQRLKKLYEYIKNNI